MNEPRVRNCDCGRRMRISVDGRICATCGCLHCSKCTDTDGICSGCRRSRDEAMKARLLNEETEATCGLMIRRDCTLHDPSQWTMCRGVMHPTSISRNGFTVWECDTCHRQTDGRPE